MVSQLLDDEDRQIINNALARVEELRPEIARAEAAGIDVKAAKTRLEESTVRLRAIKASFFPGG